MPQNIDGDTDKDVKVYFRVRDVYRNAKVVVRCGDKVLYSKKKPKLAPGEMENVTIKLDDIKSLDKKEIIVSVEVK